MKIAVLGFCCVALALGACRREEPTYQPMKLGADTVSHDSGQK